MPTKAKTKFYKAFSYDRNSRYFIMLNDLKYLNFRRSKWFHLKRILYKRLGRLTNSYSTSGSFFFYKYKLYRRLSHYKKKFLKKPLKAEVFLSKNFSHNKSFTKRPLLRVNTSFKLSYYKRSKSKSSFWFYQNTVFKHSKKKIMRKTNSYNSLMRKIGLYYYSAKELRLFSENLPKKDMYPPQKRSIWSIYLLSKTFQKTNRLF